MATRSGEGIKTTIGTHGQRVKYRALAARSARVIPLHNHDQTNVRGKESQSRLVALARRGRRSAHCVIPSCCSFAGRRDVIAKRSCNQGRKYNKYNESPPSKLL